MSFKKTLILALILLLLGIYIYVVELPHQKQIAEKGMLFPELASAEVASIEIRKDETTTILKNTAPHTSAKTETSNIALPANEDFASWELADVKGSRLDPAIMNTLIATFKSIKLEDPIPSEDVDSDLSVYGLTKPALTVQVKTILNTQVLVVGKTNEYLKKRYLKVGDGPEIYLIPETLYSAAAKTKDEFRDHAPLKFLDGDLSKVSITSGQTTVVAETDQNHLWQLVQPVKALASAAVLPETLRNLRNLKAKDYIDDASKLAEYKLDKPDVKINLEFADAKKIPPIELNLSVVSKLSEAAKGEEAKKDETYYGYITGSSSIFTLASNPIPQFVQPVDNYREKFLFRFPTEKAIKVVAEEANGAKLVVVRDGVAWKVNDKAGDNIFVNQWVANLSQLEASAFPSESKDFGFEKPRLKIVIDIMDITGKSVQENLSVGGEADISTEEKGYFATTDGGKTAFIVSQATMKKIDLREEALLPQKTAATAPSVVPVQPTL